MTADLEIKILLCVPFAVPKSVNLCHEVAPTIISGTFIPKNEIVSISPMIIFGKTFFVWCSKRFSHRI